ncbi:hypothetical protein [Paludisphaera sp.]|uniref:hypothetical protein n=1 Tax=Paludisphaera sp. TaxID=2017432 RepID=UPI00301DCC52
MPAHAGQYMRILGLLMEMFGLSSVAMSSRDGSGHWFGMTTDQVWTIVVVGFVFWAVGTVVNINEASRRRARRDDLD